MMNTLALSHKSTLNFALRRGAGLGATQNLKQLGIAAPSIKKMPAPPRQLFLCRKSSTHGEEARIFRTKRLLDEIGNTNKVILNVKKELGNTNKGILNLTEKLSKMEVNLTEKISHVRKDMSKMEVNLIEKMSKMEVNVTKKISHVRKDMSKMEVNLTEKMSNMEVNIKKKLSNVEATVISTKKMMLMMALSIISAYCVVAYRIVDTVRQEMGAFRREVTTVFERQDEKVENEITKKGSFWQFWKR